MSSHTWLHIIGFGLDAILFVGLCVCLSVSVAMAKKHYTLMQAQERANESFTKNISLQSEALGNIANKVEKLEEKTKSVFPSRFSEKKLNKLDEILTRETPL